MGPIGIRYISYIIVDSSVSVWMSHLIKAKIALLLKTPQQICILGGSSTWLRTKVSAQKDLVGSPMMMIMMMSIQVV